MSKAGLRDEDYVAFLDESGTSEEGEERDGKSQGVERSGHLSSRRQRRKLSPETTPSPIRSPCCLLLLGKL